MPRAVYERLPFDDRNEADYQEVTKKITDGLKDFEDGKVSFKSVEAFAMHVGVDKSTLYREGRKWALDEFKRIKKKTRQPAEGESAKTAPQVTIDDEQAVDNPASREKLLLKQVKRLQRENSLYFDRLQELEDENAALRVNQEKQQKDIDERDETIRKREQRIRALEKALRERQKDEQDGGKVVNLDPLQVKSKKRPADGASDEKETE